MADLLPSAYCLLPSAFCPLLLLDASRARVLVCRFIHVMF
jgi:hypothetical protein